MLTRDIYSSRHLVPSQLGLAYVLLVETNPFLNLSLFFRTMHFEHPLVLSQFLSYLPAYNRAGPWNTAMIAVSVLHITWKLCLPLFSMPSLPFWVITSFLITLPTDIAFPETVNYKLCFRFNSVKQTSLIDNKTRDACKTLMPPTKCHMRIGLTSNLDLWPTDWPEYP